MTDETKTQKSTSKVIDSLHSQIDELKNELEVLKLSHNDHKKRNTILSTKNDSLVDQLANYKHENDMINALLKRKERRITDLEAEFDLLSSESESLKLSVKNYKIRCDNLQESLASSAAEFERLKIAYDAIVAAQAEYKRHYLEEISLLSAELSNYRKESAMMLSEFMSKIDSNDKDVDVLLDSLTNKRKALDSMYVSRNKTVLDFLGQLARAAKAHGEESKSILRDNVEIINLLREKFPDLQDLIAERSEATVDLDSILDESSSCLDTDQADLSFSSVASDEISQGSFSRLKSMKKTRNRKTSRASPEVEQQSDTASRTRNGVRSYGLRSLSGENNQRNISNQRASSMHGGNSRNSSSGSNRLFSNLSVQSTSTSLSSNGFLSRASSGSSEPGANTNVNGRSSSQLPTIGSFSKNGKKGVLGPFSGPATFNQNHQNHQIQNNRNNKRRLFHGGSNNYNINSNEIGHSFHKNSVETDF